MAAHDVSSVPHSPSPNPSETRSRGRAPSKLVGPEDEGLSPGLRYGRWRDSISFTESLTNSASHSKLARRPRPILTGATGLGKSYLACALDHNACRDGYTVAYRRLSRLFDELAQARADGTYLTALRRLAKVHVLVLDDFGLEPLGAAERKVLLEVLEDRYGLAATIITSQLDPKDWHPVIGDETVADAICDRLVHGAHRIKLTGESLRKGLTNGTKPAK